MKQISMGKYLNMNEEKKRNGLRNKLVHDKIGLEYMKYFPLCIRFIFNELMTKRHIKNGGRFQLSLFLKAIGLSKNEALRFWQKYDKYTNYKYDVNYHYKTKDYSSFSCPKIIGSHTNKGDCNGCPFKVFQHKQDIETLSKLIKVFYNELSMNEIKNDILNINDYNDNQNRNKWKGTENKYEIYTSKCKRLFEALHVKNNTLIDIEDIKTKWIYPDNYFKIAYQLKHNVAELKHNFITKYS